MPGVSAVLLSAGESTRMGQLKPLLDWQGVPLVAFQVESLLEAGLTEIIVVLGHQASRVRPLIPEHPQVFPIHNRRYRSGKTSSIKAGLRHIDPQSDGVLIAGVDQPRKWQTYAQMVKEFFDNHSPPLVLPSNAGKRGHPPLFSRTLFSELMGITEARQGLREVVARHRERCLEVEVDDPLVHVNINSPEEYQEALRLA